MGLACGWVLSPLEESKIASSTKSGSNGTFLIGTALTLLHIRLSVACNSPSIGDGISRATTYIYLNDWGNMARNLSLVCIFHGDTLSPSDAVFNSTLHAWACVVPPAPHLSNNGTAIVSIHLAEAHRPAAMLPVTAIKFTYYDPSNPGLKRYDALAFPCIEHCAR